MASRPNVSGPGTFYLYPVTGFWSQYSVTWNNQPFGTSLNNPPTAQRSSSLNLMSSGTCQNLQGAYVSGWDVTTDVQNIVSLTNANNGWMIRDDTEGSNPARVANFTSRDAAGAPQAPDLVINYL